MEPKKGVFTPEDHVKGIVSRHQRLSFIQNPSDLIELGRPNLAALLKEAQRFADGIRKQSRWLRSEEERSEEEEAWSCCRFLKELVRAAQDKPPFPMLRDSTWLAHEVRAFIHLGEPGDPSGWKRRRIAAAFGRKGEEFPAILIHAGEQEPTEERQQFLAGWGIDLRDLAVSCGYWFGYFSGSVLLEWELDYLRANRPYAERFAETRYLSADHRQKYLASLGFPPDPPTEEHSPEAAAASDPA